jgi:hypothetical protein
MIPTLGTTLLLIHIEAPISFVRRVLTIERCRRQADIRTARIATGRCPECGYAVAFAA